MLYCKPQQDTLFLGSIGNYAYLTQNERLFRVLHLAVEGSEEILMISGISKNRNSNLDATLCM